MNDMSLTQILGLAISVITLVGFIGRSFYENGKRDSLTDFVEKKNASQDNSLRILFAWKDSHTDEAAEHRLKFEIALARIEGELKGIKDSHDGQFTAIMERLTRVENKIDRLEQRNQV